MNAKKTNYVKIGLAVMLAIVFVGVLANSVMTISRPSRLPPPPPRHATKPPPQPAAAASIAPASPAPHAAAAPPAAIAAPPTTGEAPKDKPSKPDWPKFTLDEIVDYDPFAIAKVVEPPASPKSTASGDPKQAGSSPSSDSKSAADGAPSVGARIQAVYQRGGQTAALAGSKTIRPGDQFEGAGRVVEVDQGGLMLELKK